MAEPLEVYIPLKVEEEIQINLKVDESGGGGEYPIYTGDTTVTPLVHQSVELQTRNKAVLSNIVVEEIPYYETSNPKGTTFIIGGN